MTIADLTSYLISLERQGYTGQVTLNFHKGSVSKKVTRKISEEVDEG